MTNQKPSHPHEPLYRNVRLFFRKWYVVFTLVASVFLVPLYFLWPAGFSILPKAEYQPPYRAHLDHSMFFQDGNYKTGQDVTRRCLECHRKAGEDLLHSAHWTWLSEKVLNPKNQQIVEVGKRNLMNNFCIATTSNEKGCTKCHAGYGWENNKFDFTRQENMDCLICHENSGTYAKGPGGWPEKSVNLAQVAKSVSYPRRENCGSCHFNGGGGMAVKHGDLDGTLINPTPQIDVHMGKLQFLCIDCHKTQNHIVEGKLNMTELSATHKGRISCVDCHQAAPHLDVRLNRHTEAIACQTCHIPTFARRIPTKMDWDWSKAGDSTRKDDAHHYLKIKGEFKYEDEVVPQYTWFNLKMHRYLTGDPISSEGPTPINRPLGSIDDPTAKIWPFKVHNAKQPFDKKNKILLPPTTAGEGGYWTEFNWDKALRLGAQANGLSYSGQYGFAATTMHWPINHMVAPKEDALKCNACHDSSGKSLRLNWQELGYSGDPILTGGRSRWLKEKSQGGGQ